MDIRQQQVMDGVPRKEVVPCTGFQWLSNNVHPIFKKDNFTDDIDYQDLTFALRFASMFLQTDRLLPFWWNLIAGRAITTATGSTAEEGARHHLEEPPEALTPAQIRTTKGFLNNLSNFVSFLVCSDKASAAHCKSFYGMMVTEPYTICPSFIYIPAGDLELLKADLEQADPIRRAAASFTLGITLLHELTHAAAAGSRHKSERDSVFIGNDKVAEDGFAFEARMFGGLVRWDREHPDKTVSYSVKGVDGPPGFVLTLQDWPNAQLVELYGQKEEDVLDVLEEPPGFYCRWHVPPSFAFKMLDEDLWRMVSKQGAFALRAPKTNGLALGRNEQGEWEAISAKGLPKGTFPVGHRISDGGLWVVCDDSGSDVTGN